MAKPNYVEVNTPDMEPRDNEGSRLDPAANGAPFKRFNVAPNITGGGTVDTMRGVDTPAREPKGE
jgi:hypothetical protein